MEKMAGVFVRGKGQHAGGEFDDSLAMRLIFVLAFVAIVVWAFNLGLALRYRNQSAAAVPTQRPPVAAQAAEAAPVALAAPSTASAPAFPATRPRYRFAVQVGAYEERAEAEQVAQAFSSTYPYVLVTQQHVGGKLYHQVRLPAETRAEAKALAAKLERDSKISTWVVPLP